MFGSINFPSQYLLIFWLSLTNTESETNPKSWLNGWKIIYLGWKLWTFVCLVACNLFFLFSNTFCHTTACCEGEGRFGCGQFDIFRPARDMIPVQYSSTIFQYNTPVQYSGQSGIWFQYNIPVQYSCQPGIWFQYNARRGGGGGVDAVVITASCCLIENKWDIFPHRVQFEKTRIESFRNLDWVEQYEVQCKTW